MITIKNLAPGKYGIMAVPPIGSDWQQTSTIEGTKVIDAWVKANEPPFFAEFGPPGYHVFIGFVEPFNAIVPAPDPIRQDPDGVPSSGPVRTRFRVTWSTCTSPGPRTPAAPSTWAALSRTRPPGSA